MTHAIVKSVLPSTWNVPALFRARLGENAGRQRAMAAEGHVLVVLHEVPQAGEPARQGRLFWRGSDGQWKSNSLGSGLQALKKHLSEYSDEVARLDSQLDGATSAHDYFVVSRAIAPLSRAARHLHAALQEARELAPDDRDLVLVRDQAVEIERAAELVQFDAKNGLEFTVAEKTEEQAERSYEMAVSAHRLNLLAAIFLPIAILSSIFGMNLEHGLAIRDNPSAFWIVLVAGFAGGILLTGVIANAPAPHGDKPASRGTKKHR